MQVITLLGQNRSITNVRCMKASRDETVFEGLRWLSHFVQIALPKCKLRQNGLPEYDFPGR